MKPIGAAADHAIMIADCLLAGCSCLGALEQIAKALLGGAFHLFDLNAVLVHLEGGHARKAGGFRSLIVCVSINLVKGELGEPIDQFLENGADALARRAPGGCEVDNEGLATVGSSDGRVEVSLGCEHNFVCHCDVRVCSFG